jgi:hypothetical protein
LVEEELVEKRRERERVVRLLRGRGIGLEGIVALPIAITV